MIAFCGCLLAFVRDSEMTTQTTTQQQLQKSYETSLEEYKDVFR